MKSDHTRDFSLHMDVQDVMSGQSPPLGDEPGQLAGLVWEEGVKTVRDTSPPA